MLFSTSALTALCATALLSSTVTATHLERRGRYTTTVTKTVTVTETTTITPGFATSTRPSTSSAKPTPTAGPSASGPDGAIALNVDFGTYTSGSAEAFLTTNKLRISTDLIGSKPFTHTFKKENVAIKDGALQLTVKAGSVDGDVSSAEVSTAEDSMVSLNITTRAKSGKSAGVCSGFFTYMDDSQEADFEILTSYITEGLENSVPAGLEFTNQATKAGGQSTNAAVPYPWDPSEDFHDYTLEWTKEATRFYVDGELWKEFTTNVPFKPSAFIWNNWSNGDENWSAGPPTEDNVLQIQKITGWYKTA